MIDSSNYEEMSKKMRYWAYKLTKNVDLVDDLVQDTMLKAHVSKHTFKENTNLSAWLRMILKNTYFDNYRKTKGKIFVDVEDSIDFGYIENTFNDNTISDELSVALDSINPTMKTIIILAVVNEYKLNDIAAILDMPLNTVKTTIFRANKKLQPLLKDYAISKGIKINI